MCSNTIEMQCKSLWSAISRTHFTHKINATKMNKWFAWISISLDFDCVFDAWIRFAIEKVQFWNKIICADYIYHGAHTQFGMFFFLWLCFMFRFSFFRIWILAVSVSVCDWSTAVATTLPPPSFGRFLFFFLRNVRLDMEVLFLLSFCFDNAPIQVQPHTSTHSVQSSVYEIRKAAIVA